MNKFLTEILEQPRSLGETLDYYTGADGLKTLENIAGLFEKENFRQIIFTGMGSSYFASYAAACLFNSLGFQSFAMNTSELLYYNLSLITGSTLLVCISQSGESIEIVKLLKVLPPNFCCVGVSNEEKSFLSTKAKETLLSKAGKEEMTSTKTYTSITLLMFILGWSLAKKWNKEKIIEVQTLIADFSILLDGYSHTEPEESEFLGEIDFVQFIGRGPSFSSACQSELMFKEAAQIASAGTLGGEFRHGPMEMVKTGFKSILFAADGITYQQSIKMAADIVKYNGKVVLITNKAPELADPNIKIVLINQPDEYFFAIQNIVPVQLMVNHIALAKGLDPGNFVNGGKVTLSE